jgi:hypothetical protein
VHIDRRMLIAGSAAALVTGSTGARAEVPAAYAPLMRRVMAMRWTGKAWTKSNAFEGGGYSTMLDINFRLAEDWSFTGKSVEILTLENRDYAGTSAIWGSCWIKGDEAALTITGSRFESGSTLPSPLSWGTFNADLRFSNDSGRPGHFVLSGTMTSDQGGERSSVQMIDNDSGAINPYR